MPYVDAVCSACGERDRRYHNVKKCRKCGQGTLLAVNPYECQSPASMRSENAALRDEVNALRQRLGIGRKYVDWSRLETNAAGHPKPNTINPTQTVVALAGPFDARLISIETGDTGNDAREPDVSLVWGHAPQCGLDTAAVWCGVVTAGETAL